MPLFEEKAQDIAKILPEIRADPESGGQKYGRREATNPYNYMVKGTGKVAEIHTNLKPRYRDHGNPGTKREGRAADRAGGSWNGFARRDRNRFLQSVLQSARLCRCLQGNESPGFEDSVGAVPAASLAGKTVTFFGTLTFDPHSKSLVLITPVKITPYMSNQTDLDPTQSATGDKVILVAEKITKRFPGTVALDQVDFTVYAGAVNVLIGENGAGKSTLMKILAGVDRATSGRLLLDGSPVEFKSTREAAQAGIGIIFQELNLYPNLSIAENIFVARELTRGGVVQHRTQEQVTSELLNRLEQPLNPATLVRDLRMGQQQIVEIAKALSQNVRILIMDEPTSALTAAETEALFRIIADLRAHGVAIIYISHKLEELLTIGDYVTVLRDGKLAAASPARSVNIAWIIEKMVGRNVNAPRHRIQTKQRRPIGRSWK